MEKLSGSGVPEIASQPREPLHFALDVTWGTSSLSLSPRRLLCPTGKVTKGRCPAHAEGDLEGGAQCLACRWRSVEGAVARCVIFELLSPWDRHLHTVACAGTCAVEASLRCGLRPDPYPCLTLVWHFIVFKVRFMFLTSLELHTWAEQMPVYVGDTEAESISSVACSWPGS